MSECVAEQYYSEVRNGAILRNEYGYVAVQRFRPSVQVIEHLYVTSEDVDRGFGQLVKHAYDNAKEQGCRYLQFVSLLSQPKIHELHRKLVDLGFYPVQSPQGMIQYERRVSEWE